ncbi:MAG: hypothetical protein GW775_00075 [Candidatus Magasanikbacteria bacterium]|nr:hypothetical protein [Candidatus Magasanikbacteria bacterium]
MNETENSLGAFQPEISAPEKKARLERLKALANTIGEDAGVAVKIGDKPGWRYVFKPVNTIEVDPSDIETKGFEYCAGLISHEAGHRKIDQVDFIPKKIWQETGFSFLMNAILDPRDNNWVSSKYEGAGKWLQAVYDEDIPTEDNIVGKAREKLGYTPKHIQFGLEVIKYWHTGEFSADLPPAVRDALEKTIRFAENAYHHFPSTSPSEAEIQTKAQEVYRIIYAKIYPEYKKLVDEALEDEAMKQLMQEMAEKGELDLPDEAFPEPKSTTEPGAEAEPEGETDEPKPLPPSKLPPELRDKIIKEMEDKLAEMGEEERSQLIAEAEQKAQDGIDGLEADLNQEIKGKLADQPETKSEEKKRMEEEDNDRQAEEKRRQEINDKLQEFEKKDNVTKNEYQRAMNEVAQYIGKITDDILDALTAKRFPRFRRAFPGQKVRLKGAMKYEGQKDYRELFDTRLSDERKNYHFLVLVDLSSSMLGEKIDETFKGVVLLGEALSRVGEISGSAKVAIFGFQDTLIPYKEFDETMDDKIRQSISAMKKEVFDQGRNNRSRYNNDGYCLSNASHILEEASGGGQQIIIWLSDGQPEGDGIHRVEKYAGLSQFEEAQKVVADISKDGKQQVLHVGLGAGTEHVAKISPDTLSGVGNIPNVKLSELVEVLGENLKKILN